MSDKALLFIHALTGVHPGSGTALGVVDLPVQRERHTAWPTIPGSSLKGVMRAECARRTGDRNDPSILTAFGPETGHASDHAGAVAFSDARMLAFPVRSLTGVFAWVTCRCALERLSRDLHLAGGVSLAETPAVEKNQVACTEGSPLIAGNDGRLLLEEFEFARSGSADTTAEWIASHAVRDAATADRLRSHLAVLHDDDFTYFARNATEVVARVGLDYEQKTARPGALFYEEYVPAETIFYSLVICSDSRRPLADDGAGLPTVAADILGWLRQRSSDVVQIGGGETVGKGLCAVNFVDAAGERDDHE